LVIIAQQNNLTFSLYSNTSTYISVVYNSDLVLYCNLGGNISFYFTENNYSSKNIITYDSVKYISLNTTVLIIKKLGKKFSFKNKQIILKPQNYIVKADIQRLYSCGSNDEVEYFIPQSSHFKFNSFK
jgi:hypothetical protein